MILVNGTKGIGTGFSSDIMSYNPKQIINYLENMLTQKEAKDYGLIEPYYKGFAGKIYAIDKTYKKYIIKGCYKIKDKNTIIINELPIGTWTQIIKNF